MQSLLYILGHRLAGREIFGIFFIVLLIIGLSISIIGYSQYNDKTEQAKINEVKNQIERQTGEQIIVKDVKKPDPTIKGPLTSVNPRYSFLNYSGYEVAFIAHDGSMGSINNLYLNYSFGQGTGYFNYIGSSATKVIKGFFTDLQVYNGINASIINGTQVYDNGQRVAQNSSLSTKYDSSNPSSYYNLTTSPTYKNDTWSGNSTNYYNKTLIDNNMTNGSSNWKTSGNLTIHDLNVTGRINVTENITMVNNGTICYNPTCSAYTYFNGTVLITKVN